MPIPVHLPEVKSTESKAPEVSKAFKIYLVLILIFSRSQKSKTS